MGKRDYEVAMELTPGSPQQQYTMRLIEIYLTGKVDDPEKSALHIWRLTRIEIRPVRKGSR